jgi:hypothetical protein
MIGMFLHGNKRQFLGRGDEALLIQCRVNRRARFAFWQELPGSEQARTIRLAPSGLVLPLAMVESLDKVSENFV